MPRAELPPADDCFGATAVQSGTRGGLDDAGPRALAAEDRAPLDVGASLSALESTRVAGYFAAPRCSLDERDDFCPRCGEPVEVDADLVGIGRGGRDEPS